MSNKPRYDYQAMEDAVYRAIKSVTKLQKHGVTTLVSAIVQSLEQGKLDKHLKLATAVLRDITESQKLLTDMATSLGGSLHIISGLGSSEFSQWLETEVAAALDTSDSDPTTN